jgi:hypothetical protein
LLDKAYVYALRLEEYDKALEILQALTPAELEADSMLGVRTELLRARIERAKRYTPLLSAPLPHERPGVTPRPR